MAAALAMMTDRERAQIAEAKLAEAEAELAEYRRLDLAREAEDLCVDRIERVREIFRAVEPEWGGSPSAVRLLLHLVDHPGERRSAAQLSDAIWPLDLDRVTTPKTLAVHICRLRKILAQLGAPGAIRNVWGHGWLLREEFVARVRQIIKEPVQ